VRYEKSSFSPRRKRGFRLRIKVCDANNVNKKMLKGAYSLIFVKNLNATAPFLYKSIVIR